ncbi:MAG: multiheme c-type cytochrome [Candidatus Glassbacteria bacterium]
MRKEAGDILLLGGGDFSDRATELGMYRTSTALKAMVMMGYDAITIGERELSMGLTYLKENLDKEKLPVVCTNLYYSGERFGEPYLIFEKNGLKVGVVSALMQLGSRQSKVFDIRDYAEELRKVLPELDAKCDIIVALSHIGFTKSFDLADEFPEIDVIIAAHGSRKVTEPTPVGNAVLAKCGNQGKWLGRLDLEVNSEGKITSHEGKLINLNPKLPEDPEMLEFFAAYQDSAKKLTNTMRSKAPEEERRGQINESDYKGAGWCRSCHTKQFNAWLQTSHSKAFAHLRKERKTGDQECLACHTTGYGQGGFTALEETPVLINVQCEACHGRGKAHIEAEGKVRTQKVALQTCTACHTDRWDPDFNYEREKVLVH